MEKKCCSGGGWADAYWQKSTPKQLDIFSGILSAKACIHAGMINREKNEQSHTTKNDFINHIVFQKLSPMFKLSAKR